MEFLYPTSRQFPFDEVCELIVRALVDRNLEVPGIQIETREYGSGEQWMRFVSEIRVDDAYLSFGRPQGLLSGGRWNSIAAVTGIGIPGMLLRVYEDHSGPRLYRYVGDDWQRDRVAFFGCAHVNSKLRGEPRTYLTYTGHGRGSRLEHDDDLGREYDLGPGDPAWLTKASVFEQVRAHLVDVVLPRILESPPAEIRKDPAAPPAEIPVPTNLEAMLRAGVFCVGSARDLDRVRRGRDHRLDPAERYGIAPGWRFASLDVRDDGTLPRIAYEGFIWCGLGEPAMSMVPGGPLPEIPGRPTSYDDVCVFRVQLASARGVWVTNHAALEARRAELVRDMIAAEQDGRRGRGDFTQEEVDDFIRAGARTIVSLVDYAEMVARGSAYTTPVVLVSRELTLDEVEPMSARIGTPS